MSKAGANERPKVEKKCFFFRRSQPNVAWTVAYGPNFVELFLRHFSASGKKRSCRDDLDQHRLKNFSSKSWIKRGVVSCAPRTSFDEINDTVVKSKRVELVRGSDPPMVYNTHSTVGHVWRAPTRLLLKTRLAAGV